MIGMFCLRALLAARYHNGIHSIPTPRYGIKKWSRKDNIEEIGILFLNKIFLNVHRCYILHFPYYIN